MAQSLKHKFPESMGKLSQLGDPHIILAWDIRDPEVSWLERPTNQSTPGSGKDPDLLKEIKHDQKRHLMPVDLRPFQAHANTCAYIHMHLPIWEHTYTYACSHTRLTSIIQSPDHEVLGKCKTKSK